MKIREHQRKINKTKNWLFEKDQWSLQASNKTDKDEKERRHRIDDTTTEFAAVGLIITKLPKRKF